MASVSAMATPLHLGRRGCEPSMPDLLCLYRRKYLGIDMVLKTVCYALRLRALYTTDADHRRMLDENILNIIDCRMLCNSMKQPGTFRTAYSAFRTARQAPDTTQWVVGLLTTLSFFFRGFEQLFGDLGYIQKNWHTHWDRMPISNKYKMFKTFSLTCCALLEIHKLRGHLRAVARRLSAAWHNTRATVHGHIRRMSGVSPPPPGLLEDRQQQQLETASIITTPVSMTPDGSPTSIDPPPRPTPFALGARVMPAEPPSPLRGGSAADEACDIISLTRLPHVRSALFLTRNIADLIVYSQWIEAWRPPKTLEHICGMISGGLGVLLVWTDVVADATGRSGPHGAGGGV